MTPVVEEILPAPDPVHCCERLDGLPYRMFLDSASPGGRLGRYSFLSADPVALVRSRGTASERIDMRTGAIRTIEGDPLSAIRQLLAPHTMPPVPGLPPFQGGAAGYIGYDWGLTLERLPAPRYDDLGLPDVVMGVYDWALAWDHETSRAWIVSTGMPETSDSLRQERAAQRASAVLSHLSHPSHLRTAPSHPRTAPSHPSHFRTAPSHPRPLAPSYPLAADVRSSFSREGYLTAVERVREYILAGDIFQANLSQRFEAPLTEPAWSFYTRLRRRNPAPFAAFLDFPEAVVVSASPERFLKVDRHAHVETRPIKGTRPRGMGPEHDAALGQALAESAKDRAENLMIVDLMRNDLSRVCAPGTVRVAELFSLEHYATVHHLVSTVVGDLAPGADALDLLRAAFPGGSVTGAPKLRAMEVIAELEPSRRGVYCGTVGYLSVTGELDTSIAIRTAVVQNGRIYFSAGGGIVADSDPGQEYLETLDKARAMIDALAEQT
jgi:para-aminobenzoate synthetase component 1